MYGDYSERVPPVPIPNTEVKPLYADNTWLATVREDRLSPCSNVKATAKAVALSLECPESFASGASAYGLDTGWSCPPDVNGRQAGTLFLLAHTDF